MLQKFLAALDGSKASESILPYLESLLAAQDADITLVKVIPGSAAPQVFQAQGYLNQAAERLDKKGAVVDAHVLTGDPAVTLTDMAARGGYSLILMSSKGRKGLGRLVLGSVAEKVVRRSPVPVLLVHADAKPKEMAPFKRILVPLDGSHRSASILPHVAALAKATGASVIFMTTVEPRAKDAAPVEVVARNLFKEQKRLHSQGIRTELVIRYGDPAEEILSFATAREADLLALSTHGRSGIDRARNGSVAESVFREGTLPLLVLRTAGKFVYDPIRASKIPAKRRKQYEKSSVR